MTAPARPGLARFALVNTLTPADVGARVVVRRKLPQGGMGDVLGELVSWTRETGEEYAGTLTVRTRRGDLVRVAARDVVAGKRVPPAAAPRARPGGGAAASVGVAELAEIGGRGWPAPEQAWLGRWELRAAGGFTGRANCVLPLGEPDRPLGAVLDAVRAWYAERGLPALVQVEPGSELDRQLRERGWRVARSGESVLVQTAPLAGVLAAIDALDRPPRRSDSGLDVRVHAEPPAGWLRLYRGGALLEDAALSEAARHVLANPVGGVTFATVAQDGEVVAGGRGVVVDGWPQWVGLTGLEVAPRHRRRGLGRLVIATLGRAARQHGAGSAYLQVSADNGAGVALYAALGFRTRYRYHYLGAPSQPARAGERAVSRQ